MKLFKSESSELRALATLYLVGSLSWLYISTTTDSLLFFLCCILLVAMNLVNSGMFYRRSRR